ncbi:MULTISPECIES: signal peptidase II [unclassified Loktanella]|jgi:signal peptidase II|uniref:signal peptidase II n=1 Tax=unclassified Loktanella TaxID=290910 RepID=UPI002570DFE1|nr:MULTISPECIES: signal peptidase II [unclassified Loktanella]
MKPPKSPKIIGLIAMISAIVIDQATKAWVVANADMLSSGLAVFPGFNLVFGRNDGVSFGLLGGVPWWSLVVLALVICAWMLGLMMRAEHRIEALAYGLVVGGALGNVVDRVRYGAVTDFLDLYVGSMHWPAFNLADALLVSGFVILLLASHLRRYFAAAEQKKEQNT